MALQSPLYNSSVALKGVIECNLRFKPIQQCCLEFADSGTAHAKHCQTTSLKNLTDENPS